MNARQVGLTLVPLTMAEANRYVERHHRHNGALPTSIIRAGIVDDAGLLRGAGVAGLPKARMLMSRYTLEINRVCTDGVPNGCSMLYGALTRAAKALGYRRLITYTLASEPGVSLRATGWTATHQWDGGSWAEMRGTGFDKHDNGPKVRWEIALAAPADLPERVLPDEDSIARSFDGMGVTA